MSQSDFQCWCWLQYYLLNCLSCRLWVNSVYVCAHVRVCACVLCAGQAGLLRVYTCCLLLVHDALCRGTVLEEIQKCLFPEQVCWKMWVVQPPRHNLNWLIVDLQHQQVAFPVDCRVQRCLCHWPPLQPKDSFSLKVKVVAQVKSAFLRGNMSKWHVIWWCCFFGFF